MWAGAAYPCHPDNNRRKAEKTSEEPLAVARLLPGRFSSVLFASETSLSTPVLGRVNKPSQDAEGESEKWPEGSVRSGSAVRGIGNVLPEADGQRDCQGAGGGASPKEMETLEGHQREMKGLLWLTQDSTYLSQGLRVQ